MSLFETIEPWLKGAVGPVIGYALGLATPFGRRLLLRASGRADLQVHVEHDPAIIFANTPTNWVGCPMFIPESPEKSDPGNIQEAFQIRQWALEQDGIPAGTDYVEITLTAWEKLDVVVDALQINCAEIPIPEGFIAHALIGGASLERRRLDVRLASSGRSQATYHDISEATTNFSFKLNEGDTAKIHLDICAADWSDETEVAYEWTADLHLLVNNKRKTITIGDNGTPFQYVRWNARPTRIWSGSEWLSEW